MSIAVQVHVYDLSQGMAKQFSPAFLGKEIGGIWHTGIVCFQTEYYFGGGICADPPGRTPYGVPVDIVPLGATSKTAGEFQAFLRSVSSKFNMSTYHLLENNCNNFSDACAKFLLGDRQGIPNYIIDLPREAMDSPMGPMIRPMIEQMQSGIRDQSAGHELQFSPNGAAVVQTPSASSSAAAVSAPTAIAACAATPLLLTHGKVAPVLRKLRELDSEFPKDGGDSMPSVEAVLAAAQRAPHGKAFPALDLLRLAALRGVTESSDIAAGSQKLLERYVLDSSSARPDCMMALRVAVNLFKYEASTVSLMSTGKVDTLIEAVAVALGHEHPAVTKTAAALAMNIAGSQRRYSGKVSSLSEDQGVRLVFAAVERANTEGVWGAKDEVYPLIGAIAVIVNSDPDSRELVRTLDLDLAPFIDAERCSNEQGRAVAMELQTLLR